jgi:ribosome-associated protein
MNSTQDFVPTRSRSSSRRSRTPARTLAVHAVDAALDRKARDITVMDVRNVSGVADYFVLCTGDSELQIKAIMEAVEHQIEERFGERPWHIEGSDHKQWVLLDYVDVVVHIFNEEKRAFYSLERLWGDAPMEEVPDEADSAAEVKLLQDAAA